jgi:hypothetical protein
MRAKVAVVAAILAVSCAGQVTEQAQGPLFWVSSVRNNPAGADQTPPFEFHWDVGTNPGRAPEKLDRYVVIVFYFGSREEHKGADPARWAGFNIPGTIRNLPEGLGVAPAFGPGAGLGPIDHFEFEFYALDAKMELPVDASIRDLWKTMDGHIVGKTTWFDRAPGLTR